MYNPSLLGFEKGPALTKSKSAKIDDYWTLVSIPEDIPKKTAIDNITTFLSGIVAMEIPTSLMCNVDCVYCYIREKWFKNTHVSVDSVSKILDVGLKHVLDFNTSVEDKYISSWGAEPFCNLDTLEYLINFCKDNNVKHTYLSTNGTVLNQRVKNILYNMFAYYKENNLIDSASIQISLDGPQHVQDKYRPMYSGESNYYTIMKFISYMNELAKDLQVNNRLYTLCSTIYLDDNSLSTYKDAIKFFTDMDNESVFSTRLPIRIENSKNFTKADTDKLYEMIKEGTEILIEKSKKTGIGFLDFYASKLFETTCRIDGWPRCSAMNTQIAIDVDGSMYMCHGPVTNSNIKPFHVFGNVLDGIIDYRRYVSVMDRMYSDIAFRSICKTCNLGMRCPGSLCGSCPPVGDSNNLEPVRFNIHLCNLYQRCYPLWQQQYEQYLKCKKEKCHE